MTQTKRNNSNDKKAVDDTATSTAMIGPAITIKGDIIGEEDVIVNGNIEGTINFKDHNILIGDQGIVSANVIARTICVEGEVKGELRGSEKAEVKPSGRVFGDIRSPRVVLHDGCHFKGSVDMEDKNKAASSASSDAASSPTAKSPANRPQPRQPASRQPGSSPLSGRLPLGMRARQDES